MRFLPSLNLILSCWMLDLLPFATVRRTICKQKNKSKIPQKKLGFCCHAATCYTSSTSLIWLPQAIVVVFDVVSCRCFLCLWTSIVEFGCFTSWTRNQNLVCFSTCFFAAMFCNYLVNSSCLVGVSECWPILNLPLRVQPQINQGHSTEPKPSTKPQTPTPLMWTSVHEYRGRKNYQYYVGGSLL